jgi:hypothetical protein
LQEQFGWFTGSNLKEYYFKPLTSTVKSIVQDETITNYVGRA